MGDDRDESGAAESAKDKPLWPSQSVGKEGEPSEPAIDGWCLTASG